jgi:micrococcal nuclease
VKYRLLGFDAPETFYGRCDRELQLGMKAKARLEQLIGSGRARIIQSGRLDRYRRSLATLEVNGKDVAGVTIGEGLARPYHGERRRGWCE